jgi:Amt family ammonium transporter
MIYSKLTKLNYKIEYFFTNSISDVFLGTALLWFGWFGFNGGSELAIDSRAVNALIVTNLSACVGGLAWMITDMIWNKKRKMSLNCFCAGAVAGKNGEIFFHSK